MRGKVRLASPEISIPVFAAGLTVAAECWPLRQSSSLKAELSGEREGGEEGREGAKKQLSKVNVGGGWVI